MNKRLNKFSFYSAKYWKGKMRGHLNDIFVVSISFLFFLFFYLISILFFLVLISILFYIVLTTYYIV